MLYTIGQVNEFTSAKGNKYKRCNVKDPSGAIYREVSVFTSSAFYNDVIEGKNIEGVLKEGDFKGKKQFTLEAPYQPRTGGGGKAMGTEMIKQKTAAVQAAQDNKYDSIKVASTFTAAWNTTIASFGGKAFEQDAFQKEFKMWRRYFVNNYEIEENPALTSHGTEVPWPEDKASSLITESEDIKFDDESPF